MNSRHRLVVIFAHPDDESFGFAGSLSALADLGHESTYVCATRGEAGEIVVDGLTTKDELGVYREGELRAALDLIGVNDLRLLGFRDSGMAGSPENADPRAFVNQDVDSVANTVANILLENRPTIVLTYGPDGIYGHPDHIMAHKVGQAAVLKAGESGWQTPNLYFSAGSQERVRRQAQNPDHPFHRMSAEELAEYGMPASQITTWIDVSNYWERKLSAIRAHTSQVGVDGPFARIDPAERQMWLSTESARMIPLPWNLDPHDVLLDILPEAPKDHPFRIG